MRKWLAAARCCSLALIGLWELVVRAADVPDYLFPAPSAVAARARATTPGCSGGATLVTAREMLLGYLLAVAVGLGVRSRCSTSRPSLRRALLPLLVLSQTVPTVVLAPILAILLGYGIGPKLVVVAIVCFFPIVVNAVDGLRATDPELVRMMRTLHGTALGDLPPRRVSGRAADDLLRRAHRGDLRRGRSGLRRVGGLLGGARLRHAAVPAVARHRADLRRPSSILSAARARAVRRGHAARAVRRALEVGSPRMRRVGRSSLLVLALAACGGAAAATQRATLTLDWTPNPDHVGFYYARDTGLFAQGRASTSRSTPPPIRPRRSSSSPPAAATSPSRTSRRSSSPRPRSCRSSPSPSVIGQPLNSFMSIEPSDPLAGRPRRAARSASPASPPTTRRSHDAPGLRART